MATASWSRSEGKLKLFHTVVSAHLKALITKYMSTTDGAIDQKLSYDLEWIYHCLLLKTVANETSAINKILFITFSTNKTT